MYVFRKRVGKNNLFNNLYVIRLLQYISLRYFKASVNIILIYFLFLFMRHANVVTFNMII